MTPRNLRPAARGSLTGWLPDKPSAKLPNMRLEATNGTTYVEQRDESYWVEGTRVSLDSVVYAFWNGQTPESIVQSFPTLTLEQVYGAVAFYLAHRDEVDRYLAEIGRAHV